MKKDKHFQLESGITGLLLILSANTTLAQTLELADQSTPVSEFFLKAVNWGLLVLALVGLLIMPLAGLSWYKKNKADHMWIDFFKSGTFALRISVIIVAFILWLFKIVDFIVNLLMK